VLGRHVLIIELLGLLLGPVEDLLDLPAEGRFRTSALGREAGKLPVHPFPETGHVHPGLLEERLHHPLVLGQERSKQVGVIDDRVAPLAGQFAGVPERLRGLDGQSFWSNHGVPPPRMIKRSTGKQESEVDRVSR
jgi:hypothetical protein